MNRHASTCRSALLLCGALLLLGGCASRWQDMFVSYSDQMVPLHNQLLLGHAADSCLQWVDNQAEYRLRHGLDQVSSQLTNDQSMAYLPPTITNAKNEVCHHPVDQVTVAKNS